MASPGGRMMTAKRPINKRKRGSPEPEPDAAPPELPPSSPTSSSTSEQSEQAMLDSFKEATAAPVEAFNDAAADATAFLQPSEQISGLARQAAKALYDYTATLTQTATGNSHRLQTAQPVMPQLHVEGFDAEQIWLQLDMASAHVVRRARRLLKKAGNEPELLTPEMDEDLEDLLKGGNLTGDDSAGLQEDDLDLSDAEAASEEDADMTDGDEGDEEEEDDAGEAHAGLARQKRKSADTTLLPTEDRFLKLDDLESFLQDSERVAAHDNEDDSENRLGEDDEDEDESEEEDLMLDGGDIENDSDADLDALLEDANRLVGRPSTGRKRAKTGKGRHVNRGNMDEGGEDDEEEGQDVMYEDFWGSSGAKQGRAVRKGSKQGDLEDADLDLDADEDDDLEEGVLEKDDALDDELQEDNELDDDEDEDGMGIFNQAVDHSAHALLANADEQGLLQEDGLDRGKTEEALSKHERQQRRMQERIAKLEAQNMAEKDWFMQGESGAAKRPLNSALELDLDFERQVRPPPQPTEEATASLEDLIKQRIADQVFDDPPKVLPPQPEKKKVELDLEDKKSHKGLGEVYEEEYVAAAHGVPTAEDKENTVRREARTLMKELFAKLDALSHFHFAPKPVVEEMSVRADVPALAMEEVAPQVASEAAMRAPEEVYKAQQGGAPRAAEELTREERSAARQKRKRAGKKQKAHQVEDKRTIKPEGNVIGLKSEKALAARTGKKGKKAKSSAPAAAEVNDAKFSYSKSGAVFKKLQEQRDAAAAGIVPARSAVDSEPVRRPAAALKL